MVEKNYSYLAIQLSKFCQAYGRRQLEIALLQLREHVRKVDTHQVSSYICKLHELQVRFYPRCQTITDADGLSNPDLWGKSRAVVPIAPG